MGWAPNVSQPRVQVGPEAWRGKSSLLRSCLSQAFWEKSGKGVLTRVPAEEQPESRKAGEMGDVLCVSEEAQESAVPGCKGETGGADRLTDRQMHKTRRGAEAQPHDLCKGRMCQVKEFVTPPLREACFFVCDKIYVT